MVLGSLFVLTDVSAVEGIIQNGYNYFDCFLKVSETALSFLIDVHSSVRQSAART
jgi:hypothetical protein